MVSITERRLGITWHPLVVRVTESCPQMSAVTKNECKRYDGVKSSGSILSTAVISAEQAICSAFICVFITWCVTIHRLLDDNNWINKKKNKLIMDSNSWEATNKHLVFRRIGFIISVWYWFFFGMFFFCAQETYFFEIPNKSIDKNQKKFHKYLSLLTNQMTIFAIVY